MSIIKLVTRRIVSPLLVKLGVDRYFLSKTEYTCCIVNFHGVRQSTSGIFNNRHLPVGEFEKIILYLKKRYSIITLQKAFETHRNAKKFNRKTIAITFDDGYLNNFEQALPILKKHQVPATFYIVSKGLTDPDFYVWPDIVDLIQQYYSKKIEVNGYFFTPPQFHNPELNLSLLNYLKTLGSDTENIVKELVIRLNMDPIIKAQNPEYLNLVKSEHLAKYKNEPLLEFGSHTHTHFNLEHLNSEEALREMKQSKELIEKFSERNLESLAFPDGSYNPETIQIALKHGFVNLVAVDYKLQENNSNPNVLSRFSISNSTTSGSNALRLARQFQKYGFC